MCCAFPFILNYKQQERGISHHQNRCWEQTEEANSELAVREECQRETKKKKARYEKVFPSRCMGSFMSSTLACMLQFRQCSCQLKWPSSWNAFKSFLILHTVVMQHRSLFYFAHYKGLSWHSWEMLRNQPFLAFPSLFCEPKTLAQYRSTGGGRSPPSDLRLWPGIE